MICLDVNNKSEVSEYNAERHLKRSPDDILESLKNIEIKKRIDRKLLLGILQRVPSLGTDDLPGRVNQNTTVTRDR